MGRSLSGAAVLVSVMLLSACSGATVQLDDDIPSPLVEPLPLKMGVYLQPALTQYVYEERIQEHGDWRIEVGPMQSKLFMQMADALFQKAVRVSAITPLEGDLDGVLVPSIADFQISIPEQTRSDFYEVWIKYSIRVYDKGGQLVADWPLTAYGKASEKDYSWYQQTQGPAMQVATLRALRDAGAFLVMGFPKVPAIRAWMNTLHTPGATP
jgi:hypothetical protein